MQKLLSPFAFLLLLSCPAVAHSIEPTWIENGAPAAADPARSSNGKFGAMLVLTDDWDGFLKRWEQPTAGFWAPTVNSVQKGRPLMSAVIFTGCEADQTGNCSISADFLVTDPKGKTYAEQRGAKVWNLPPPPELQLSVDNLGLSLDPPDPLGTYIVTAIVTDRVANKTVQLRTTFQAK